MSIPENNYIIKSQIPRADKELVVVHVLKKLIFYLKRQDTFINKKNEWTLSELSENKYIPLFKYQD